jgi:hypothetical protein
MNPCEHIYIARDEGRLGGDRKMQPGQLREHLEHRASQPELALRWLVRIGRGPNRDGIVTDRRARKSPPEHLGRHPFDEDAPLEVHRIAQLEEIVGIARIAVDAAELAPAIGVDSPSERHVGRGPVEHAARGDLEVSHLGLSLQQFALGSHPGDAD